MLLDLGWHFICWRRLRRGRVCLQSPLIPVVPKQLCRVLGSVGAIATPHVFGRAVQVATPAHPLGVGGGFGKLLDGCHGVSPDGAAGLLCNSALFALGRHVGATAVGNFRRHANAFAQRGVRVDGLADVHRVGAHFDGQSDLANHVACMGAHDAAAQNLAVAMGLGRVVEQQLGVALVAAVGDGAARGGPGEQALLDLDALGLGLVFGQADPGDLGGRCRPRWGSRGR